MRGLTFLFSLIVLLVASTPAQAEWRGFAVTDVNMRTGPGTGYGIIDVVPEGARVFVDACRGGWCAVIWHGEEGYVSSRYLEQTRVRDYAPRQEIYPPVYGAPGYREPYYVDDDEIIYRQRWLRNARRAARQERRLRRELRRERRVREEAERVARKQRRERRANRNRNQAVEDAPRRPRGERRNAQPQAQPLPHGSANTTAQACPNNMICDGNGRVLGFGGK